MSSLESRLIIRAEDKASAEIGKIGKMFDALAKSTRAAAKIDVANKSVGRLRQQGEAIDKFRQAHVALSKSRTDYRAAEVEVRRLARAVAQMDAPSRQMETAFKRSRDAVKIAAEEFNRHRSAVAASRKEMQTYGVSLNQVGSAEQRIQRVVARAQQMARGRANRPAGGAPALASSSRGVPEGRGRYSEPAEVAGGAGVSYGAKRLYEQARDNFLDLDEEQRRQAAIFDFNARQQKILEGQQFQIGKDTRYSNADVTRGQTTIGQRLQKAMQTPEIISAIAKNAQYYAQSMDSKDHPITFNQAAAVLLQRMMSMGYDMSSPSAIEGSSRHASNRLVQMSKISGMTHDDIEGYLKFGGAPGHTVGLPEDTMDAIAATLKRVGYEGSMTGNFIRAIASRVSLPTRKAQDAMSAMGVNYAARVRPGVDPSASGYQNIVERRFGRKMSPEMLASLREAFDDPETMKDQTSFTTAMSELLRDKFLKKTKKGAINAQEAERLAKASNDFYKYAAAGVDADGLINDILNSGKLTVGAASALFGQEHGGRLVNLKPKEFSDDKKTMRDTPANKAQDIAERRMQGPAAAYNQMQGAIETLYTRIGQVNAGPLESFYRGMDNVATRVGEMPDKLLQLTSAVAAATAAFVAAKTALTVGAAAGVPGAAAAGAVVGATPGVLGRALLAFPGAAGGLAGLGAIGGVAYALGEGVNQGIKNYEPKSAAEQDDIRGRILALEAKITDTRARSKLPEIAESLTAPMKLELQDLRNRLGMGAPGRALPSFAHRDAPASVDEKFDPTSSRRSFSSGSAAFGQFPLQIPIDAKQIDEVKPKSEAAGAAMKTALDVTVKPHVDSSDIDGLNAKIQTAIAGLQQLGSAVRAAGDNVGRQAKRMVQQNYSDA